jgi:acetyl esterase/lipase
MEVKEWSYEEFPEFSEQIEGVSLLSTTGDEVRVTYLPDVEYVKVDGVPLRLQILMPKTRNDEVSILPCVVHVQGSAWMKQNLYGNLPLYMNLAKRGYVVAIVEYRHSGIAPFPAQAIDARNAIRFLRKNAQEYRINPDKIILSGDSSGGHTAMFAGIRHNDDTEENLYPGISAEVRGIIDFYGSVSVLREDGNPSTINHHKPDSPEGMEMGGVDLTDRQDLKEQLTVESNITEETELVPVLIFHGTKDRTVNTWQSIDLYRKLKAVGKDVSIYLIEGADHGGAEFWTDQVLDLVENFICHCFESH